MILTTLKLIIIKVCKIYLLHTFKIDIHNSKCLKKYHWCLPVSNVTKNELLVMFQGFLFVFKTTVFFFSEQHLVTVYLYLWIFNFVEILIVVGKFYKWTL